MLIVNGAVSISVYWLQVIGRVKCPIGCFGLFCMACSTAWLRIIHPNQIDPNKRIV